MKLIIDKHEVKVEFNKDDKEQRDLTIHEDGTSGIIVYGYPYSINNPRWLKAIDVYKMYKGKGDDFTSCIDGSFAILFYDKQRKTVKTFIDPYKIYTFYLHESEHKIDISNSLSEIISGNSSINHTAVLEFLHFGFVIGDKTIIDGINTMHGGTTYTIESNLKVKRAQNFSFAKVNKEYTKSDFSDAFNNNLSIVPQLSNKVSLPLTGGLDSRTILSGSLEFKDNLHCYTHGLSNSEDVKIAKKISNELRLSHSHYNELNDSFIKGIPDIAKRLTDNFEGMLNSILFSHLESSYNKEAKLSDTFLTGIAGEMFRHFYLPSDYEYSGIDNLSLLLKDRILVNQEYGIFKSKSGDVSELLINSIKEELEGYESDDPVFLIDLFYLKNRIGNFGSYSTRLLGKRFNVFNPYLSKELISIALNLNKTDKSDGVQNFTIMENSEILSNFPVSGGRFINKSIRTNSYNEINKYKTYVKKVINKVTNKSVFNFNFVDYPKWLRENQSNFVKSELRYDNLKTQDITDEKLLKEYIDKFLNGQSNITYQITNLLSLQLYLKDIQNK